MKAHALTAPPVAARFAFWQAALHTLLWSVGLAAAVLILPRFAAVFADYGVDLPRIAVASLRVGEFTAAHPVLALAAVLVLGLVDYAILYAARRRGVGWGWAAVLMLLPLLGLLALIGPVLAVYLELLSRLKG